MDRKGSIHCGVVTLLVSAARICARSRKPPQSTITVAAAQKYMLTCLQNTEIVTAAQKYGLTC